jgi:ketosteroid isomerase-like protein
MMRRRNAAAGLLYGALFMVSCRRPIPTATDRDSIAATVNAFHEALARGDENAAADLLAADAQVLESGVRETRDQYLREHLSADITFAKSAPSTRSAMIVRQENSTAWTTATSTSKGQFNGREIDSVGTELMVLSQRGNEWRIRAIHWSAHDNR